jgi:hypothetical protein
MAKVFLSSTIADLKPERRAVLDWLLAARHQAVDSYLPDSETVRDGVLELVDECDLYVLILGYRYGFQPTVGNPEQLSITHLEFRRAGELGKPRIALLRTTIPDVSLSDMEDPVRAQMVQAFREEVTRAVRAAEFSDMAGLIQGLSTGIMAELDKVSAYRGDASQAQRDFRSQIPETPTAPDSTGAESATPGLQSATSDIAAEEPTSAARTGSSALGELPPRVIPLVAGYAADTVEGHDELGITADVDSLCSVLMASQVQPPLSVGLFGDWGSGKSFFMQRMRERIDWIAAESKASRDEGRPSDFCENVKQITFNAWHYVDANLWASLAIRLFDGLLGVTDDQVEPLTPEQRRDQERRGRRLLAQLETAELLAGDARRQRFVAEQRLQEKVQERKDRSGKLERLTELRASDIRSIAQHNPEEVTQAFAMVSPQLREHLEVVAQAHGVWSTLAGVWAKLGRRARWETAGLGLLSVGLIVGGLLAARSGVARALPLIVAAASLLGLAARWLPQIRSLRAAAQLASQAIDQAVSREQSTVDAEIATAQAEIDLARRQLAEADAEITEIDDGRRLNEFIATRASSTDYQRNLGFIAVLRRDLARLSHLMSSSADDQEYQIDRIVLYIDDLDRCPAGRVAEVLQAVHLLLAFPLFIVVVGADARWLLRSLELHYADLMTAERTLTVDPDPEVAFHWSSTPQNYLDKIFQIPFSLKPMDAAGFKRLIRSTAGAPDSVQRAGDTPESRVDGETNAAAGSASTAYVGPTEDSPVEISLTDLTEAWRVSRSEVPGSPAALAFLSEGHRLVVVCDHPGTGSVVTTLDARTGAKRGSWATGGGSCTLSTDGSLVAVQSAPKVRLSAADGGRSIKTVEGSFSALYFSVDGTWLTALRAGGLTAFDSAGRTLWDRPIALPEDLRWLAVLPGEMKAIIVGQDTVSTIELESGGQRVTFDGQAKVCACSRDGKVLATADSDSLRIFDIPTSQRRHWLTLNDVCTLAISPDGSTIAAGLRKGIASEKEPIPTTASSLIVVLDTGTGKPFCKATFGAEQDLRHLAFSANGRSLAALDSSGNVRVWSLASTATNLRSESLQLTEPELAFLERLSPLIRTPRAAKRLVNVYRILRAPLNKEMLARLLEGGSTGPEHPAVLLLLTVVTGFPDPAQSVIGELLKKPSGTWADFIEKYRTEPRQQANGSNNLMWKIFFHYYDQADLSGLPEAIDTYVRWAPYAARYSFRTGRLLS